MRDKFLTNTDETGRFVVYSPRTGRFVVYSPRTGRSYYVEPMGDPHVKWGSVDPSGKELMVKKGWRKHTGSISEKESLITEENGFQNIRTFEPGLSPIKAIEYIDDQYPDSN